MLARRRAPWSAVVALALITEAGGREGARRSTLQRVVMVARHGVRAPYGLRLDNPSTDELAPYALNMSLRLDREAWQTAEWQGLTTTGAEVLREMGRAARERYHDLLFGGRAHGTGPREGPASCAHVANTPDSDVRNMESGAHFTAELLGAASDIALHPRPLGSKSEKPSQTERRRALKRAATYGGRIGACEHATTRPPEHVLRQGGDALPGLPESCATVRGSALRKQALEWEPHAVLRRMHEPLQQMGQLLGCCAPSLCNQGSGASWWELFRREKAM